MRAKLCGGVANGQEIQIRSAVPVINVPYENEAMKRITFERYIYSLTDGDTAIYWAETEEDRKAAEFNRARREAND